METEPRDLNQTEKVPEEESPEQEGWNGKWSAGERPEGYKRTTERYLRLKKDYGFSITKELGEEFAEKNIEIVNKAKQGVLSGEELEMLLDCNGQINNALDNFEKRLRGEK